MGFFGIFKKSDKSDDSGDEKRHRKNKDKNEHKENVAETSPKPRKRKGTLKRRLSSNSFKRIREIGICLRLIGDDLERRSLTGSQRNVNDEEQAKNQENINKNKENNDRSGSST